MTLKSEIAKVLVAQVDMLDKLLLGPLVGGHVLLEGMPRLAKILLVNTLAEGITIDFSCVQFTRCILPDDATGPQVYNPREATYSAQGMIISTH